MELILDHGESITVVTYPDSNLDASNNRVFIEVMGPIIDQNPRIIFDMIRLRFVDSSGLGSILLCARRLKTSGGILKLCGLSPSVQALFELVRMHRVFDIYSTREDAIKSFQT